MDRMLGTSLIASTVMVTVVVAELRLPSDAVYVNVSVPVKLVFGL